MLILKTAEAGDQASFYILDMCGIWTQEAHGGCCKMQILSKRKAPSSPGCSLPDILPTEKPFDVPRSLESASRRTNVNPLFLLKRTISV